MESPWIEISSNTHKLRLRLRRVPRLELVRGYAVSLTDVEERNEPVEDLEDLRRFGFEVPDVFADLIDILDEIENSETWH